MTHISKASPEQIRQFIKRMHQECMVQIHRSIVPFYAEQNGEPKQCGTGVLLQIADKHFVLTAAHVLDLRHRHNLPLGISNGVGGHSLIPFQQIPITASAIPESGDRNDDCFDIGVGELPQSIVEELRLGKQFLHLRDIDPYDKQERTSWYFLLGFPSAANPTNVQARVVSYHGFAYGCQLYSGDRGELPRFNRDVEIALDFGHLRKKDEDGNPIEAPPPRGLSGCGIWRLAEPGVSIASWNSGEKRLVGIQHTWNKDLQVLRGTRINYVFRLIRRKYPELLPAFRLNYEPWPQSWMGVQELLHSDP